MWVWGLENSFENESTQNIINKVIFLKELESQVKWFKIFLLLKHPDVFFPPLAWIIRNSM